ncbi:sigma-70 family RNA polymerase sigma factor [Formosa sediminum]|uniref:Sigma-70 family RNA polymerase sigma factor n=1 Tax=Formosa sediminum TaxID=2594004 RepID=A0A516GUG8_9FLAO|nr:sigma-70 family RNA polymerase sigma factor [Formosa sediminum]QDO95161.1 sigma-70 family RNA polymerase sigma factor [Formosa sediminum]
MNKTQDYNNAYNMYWYELFAYANNILRSREAAEDIIQEVFLDLWKRLDDLSIDHYRAYLYKAVKFQCAKKLRSTPFTEIMLEKLEGTLNNDESEAIKSIEENKLLLVQKIDILAHDVLPERCLLIFKLRFKENLSYKEIANRLDISTSTVDNQINKALRILRESGVYNSEMVLFQILLAGLTLV